MSDPLEIIKDPDILRVVLELACWQDDHIPYARQVAQDIGMPIEQLRRILQRLIDGGYATYGPLYREDDGMPMGSSYWLTERGMELRQLAATGDQ